MEGGEFIDLVKETHLSHYSVRLAYRALVVGDKNVNIAHDYGVKRQVVEQAKNRVLRQKTIKDNIPDSWKYVSLHLPKELSEIVTWIEEQAKYQSGLIIKKPKRTPVLSVENIELLTKLIC